MLLVATLFASLVLVSSARGRRGGRGQRKVASAHLEGGVPAGAEYPANQVITAWNPDDPKSHVVGRFEYKDGELTVPKSGRYNVYMQMFFRNRPDDNKNRVALYADDRILLMIHKDLSAGQASTGFAGGVFNLEEGEKIYVKVLFYNTNMWLGPNHCYFGAYWI